MPTDKPMRYPVQDVYVIDGRRIFVGRVESGIIKEGDEVTVLPDPRKTKIKSIEVYMKDVKEAEAGMSVGVTTADKLFIERGNVLCSGELPEVTDTLNARVFWMSRNPMEGGERLVLRLATQEVDCSVNVNRRIDSSTLKVLGEGGVNNNEVAEAEIKTEKPVVVEDFNDIPELGRFVLVRGNDVVAGGIVT
jgi:sulfate adenylyltransferase subunit 1 (EFTu-like GTPase family)